MSSEKLGHNNNVLQETLGGGFNILTGSSGEYTDLGIARRFGGAAAAYSLRDIGAMNGPVAKVRRDVDGDGTDKEEDFSASQVQSGALEDWVNGKLENTLPADVATAAAAYSLRKVKASYAEDAVRIRRSSDGVEVDVAFDSDDKVSSSSPITDGGTELTPDPDADLGSTSATTLGSFLSEKAPNFSGNALNFDGSSTYVNITQLTLSGDFTFSFDAFVDFNNGGGGRVAGRTTAAGWVANITDSTTLSFRANGSGGKSINFDSAISSGEHSFVLTRSSNTVSLSIDGVTQANTRTEENNFTINFIGRQAGNYFKGSLRNINFGSASYNGYGNTDADWEDQTGSNDGTVNGTANTFIGDSAFLHTWYDQSPSGNDLVQGTAGNQPKIAENGALLTDGLDFDGSSSYLDANSALGATATVGAFIVHKPDDTDANRYLIDNRDAVNDGMRIMQREESSGNYRVSMDTTEVDSASGSVTTNETLLTAIQSSTALTLFKNSASQDTAADDAISVTAAFRIGANRVSLGTYFDGTMKEIILFTSDETDNRFKIESNINNHYGLYTFQGDGFVETWYDQSGNGNDATQGTAAEQPKIVSNGSIVTETQGKPAIQFSTSAEFLTLSTTNLQSIFSVVSNGDVAGDEQVLISNDGVNNKYIRLLSGGTDYNPTVKLGSPTLTFADLASEEQEVGIIFVYNRTDANNNTVHINNSAKAIISGTDTDLNTDIDVDRIGTRNSNLDPWAGKMQEIIVFDKDMSSDRTDLQNDMANFYNITLS